MPPPAPSITRIEGPWRHLQVHANGIRFQVVEGDSDADNDRLAPAKGKKDQQDDKGGSKNQFADQLLRGGGIADFRAGNDVGENVAALAPRFDLFGELRDLGGG